MIKSWNNIVLCFMLLLCIKANGQQLIEGEYFWDTDPGINNGTSIAAQDGAFDEAIEEVFASSINTPSAGMHSFNLRIKGEDGTWSNVFSYVVNVKNNSIASRDIKVIQAEYFWDTDPGEGTGTPILALDGALDEAIEQVFASSINTPSAGMHSFNLRVKGQDGTWSNVFSYVVNIKNNTIASRDIKVIQAEYFWDTDSGEGTGTPILALDGALDEAIEQVFASPINTPSAGMHSFNLRVKGQDGTWSNVFTYVVNVRNNTIASRDVKVIQAEYFWDTDPGEGTGTPILALDGGLDEAVEQVFASPINTPSTGMHSFNLRVKGQDGAWSNVFTYVVNVKNNTIASRDIKVIEAEYFWGTDPGEGNGSTILALDGNLNEALEQLFTETIFTPEEVGLHLFSLRVKGEDGTWSSSFSHAVYVSDYNSYITQDITICDGDSYTAPSGNEAYTTAGTYYDTLTNIGGYDSLITTNLMVNFPSDSSLVVSSCDSYIWTSTGLTYTSSGTYKDTLVNWLGCDSIVTLNLTINNSSTSTDLVTVCDSYNWIDGNTYTSSNNTATHTLTNAVGCDSIITLNLTINYSSTYTDVITADNSYTWIDGNTYNSSNNTATFNIVGGAPNGCDSLIILDLTINKTEVYVDRTASGSNDGSSWANAFNDLQDAIAQASVSANIYIAEGIYKPTSTTSRGIFFTLDKDLEIYGGFPNGGGVANAEMHLTRLSGDINNDGTHAGNSFHVVQVQGGATVSINGLTIRGGNADNANSFARARGGGIYVTGANLNLTNCKIINNKAIFGGGMFATLSNQTYLLDCLFDSNEAGNGSAIYHSNETNLYLVRSRVLNNNSTIRCAIEINNSLYTYIENSIIANNPSTNANALGLIATNRDQTCDVFNSTILGESKNKNLITLQIGFGDELTFNINNSIVAHQNTAFNKNVVAYNNNLLNFNHNNCYFQGASVIGTGTNALFSATAGDLLLNPDYSVAACSPIVNSGDNIYTTNLLINTDIAGESRIYNNSIVDIGAYESQEDCAAAKFGESIENLAKVTYSIYPNPAKNIVHITSESEQISVALYDILGKEMIFKKNQNTLDLSSLPGGTYLVHIYDGDTLLGVEKLIKY